LRGMDLVGSRAWVLEGRVEAISTIQKQREERGGEKKEVGEKDQDQKHTTLSHS